MPVNQSSNALTVRAKTLRQTLTKAEAVMWMHLSGRKLAGFKFSRQIPFGPFIVDFICRETKLIIEIDGQSHDASEDYDRRRTATLERLGYRVIRFSNEEVLGNVYGVLDAVERNVRQGPTPAPPPWGGDIS
jgi:very-short-patch-repair endonuclease